MIRVLYDHQKFSGQQYGGISRYYANLIAGVNAAAGFEARVSMVYNKNQYISHLKFPLDNVLGNLIFGPKPSRIDKWNKQYSKYRIRKNDFDVLHPTYYHPYFLKGLRKPYVLTVHDMIYELLPEHFLPGEKVMAHKKTAVNGAAHIIAISAATKNDLMTVLNVPARRISVVQHGISAEFESCSLTGLPQKFLLFVGERPNYKNFSGLLNCFAELRKQDADLNLVCAGGGPFSLHELQLQSTMEVTQHCIQLSVNDEQLNYLYQQAAVFVFPSFYEGFGYPLLEAFRTGCAVAASNSSSFTEVGGNAVKYFNPHSADEMYSAVYSLLNNDDLKQDLIKKGYERLSNFSLQNEVDATLDIYRQVVK